MNQVPHPAALYPPAVSGGWFYVPYAAMGGRAGVETEKLALTFKPKFAEEDAPPVTLYRDLPGRNMLAVPRAYGQARFPWLTVVDQREAGVPWHMDAPRLPDPNHPRVKEPERQAAFMRDMLNGVRTHENFIAMAATGSGKTVVALWLAAHLKVKTLILVHLERLRDQWVDEIKDKLGLTDDEIGIVQGDTCTFEGKLIVVGMMPSIAQRQDYPRAFYKSFGLVVVDECHRVGAPFLSTVPARFPARYRIGLSATPTRKDGADRVGFWHIGPIKVTSSATALDCTVYVKRYASGRPLWGKDAMMRSKCLASDPYRNAMLADLIVRNYRVGRNILVIGKLVAHLQDLMQLCAAKGVPVEQMGQYTGERLVREQVDTPAGPRLRVAKKVKLKKAEYDRVKADCQIIFATYGVFKEGIDVPRLDCGIDVLPQSEATQVIGRIRRPVDGKPLPYWITILDTNCSISKRLYDKRCRDYLQTGCKIVDNGKL